MAMAKHERSFSHFGERDNDEMILNISVTLFQIFVRSSFQNKELH